MVQDPQGGRHRRRRGGQLLPSRQRAGAVRRPRFAAQPPGRPPPGPISSWPAAESTRENPTSCTTSSKRAARLPGSSCSPGISARAGTNGATNLANTYRPATTPPAAPPSSSAPLAGGSPSTVRYQRRPPRCLRFESAAEPASRVLELRPRLTDNAGKPILTEGEKCVIMEYPAAGHPTQMVTTGASTSLTAAWL